MRRAGWIFVLAAGVMVCLRAGAAGAAGQSRPSADPKNAAHHYRNAFELLPERKSPDRRALEGAGEVGPERAAALLGKYGEALEYLRDGARANWVQWDAVENRKDVFYPHLNDSMALAGLGRLKLAEQLREGQLTEAAETAADLIVFARHVGGTRVVRAQMMEGEVIEAAATALAPAVGRLPEAALRVLDERLASLPPAVSVHEAVGAELGILRKRLRDAGANEGRRVAEFILPERADEAARRQLAELWPDEKQRGALITEGYQLSVVSRSALGAPPERFARESERYRGRWEAAAPLVRLLAPEPASLTDLRERGMAADVYVALLRTATKVRLEGAGVVEKSRDPAGKGPLEYEAKAGGFELRSALEVAGKRAVLAVTGPG